MTRWRIVLVSVVILVARVNVEARAAKAIINADNVLEIDGKKTFVIGFIMPPRPGMTTPWGKSGIEELADAGATFLRTGIMGQGAEWNEEAFALEQRWQDAAAKHGMHCLIGLRQAGSVDSPEKEELLRKIVSRFADHPGMGAYYGVDEPQWMKHPVEPMLRAYRVIKEMDPDHPVWVNHAPRGTVEELQAYNETCDATGLDIYPIGYPPGEHSLGANKHISMVGDHTQHIMRAAAGKKPVWNCLQIAWSGVVKPGKTLTFPTFPQQRYMTYQTIINGARGVIYFGGQLQMTLTERDKKHGWNWTYWQKVLRPVIEEIGTKSPLYPALVAADSKIPVRCVGSSGMEIKVRKVGDEIFIMAAKREGDTVRVEFVNIPEDVEPDAQVMFEEPRTVKVEGGKFTDWFAPFEVHVYRLKRKN
jgi:hypothetical protein